jgi:hypothetical protein
MNKPMKTIFSSTITTLGVALLLASAPAFAQQSSEPSRERHPAEASQAPVSDSKPEGKPFSSPDAAAEAFCAALRNDDNNALLAIFGPHGKDVIAWSNDPSDQVGEQRRLFVQRYDQMHRLVNEPDRTVALYIGAENWPLPIPIVQYEGAWYFDVDLGRKEILFRRIGRNEMAAMDVSRGLIDAEKEFYAVAHAFTNKFTSSPNTHDGLYWKTGDTNTRSPIGSYLAQAGVTDSFENHQAFHGYYYRILLQTPAAPNGDAHNSMNNFAIVAFPAEYRSSGVMTFLYDESGQAYEKDLGANTASAAMQITSAHPDPTWHKLD